jgi:hypothetical protein
VERTILRLYIYMGHKTHTSASPHWLSTPEAAGGGGAFINLYCIALMFNKNMKRLRVFLQNTKKGSGTSHFGNFSRIAGDVFPLPLPNLSFASNFRVRLYSTCRSNYSTVTTVEMTWQGHCCLTNFCARHVL